MKNLLLWLSDAATMFLNGFVSGLGAGVIIGGAAAAQTDTVNAQTISTNAAVGVIVTAGANGLKRVVVWHDRNPIPNPFRVTPPDENHPPTNSASPTV